MGKGTSKSVGAYEREPASLSELIHQHVRVAIETAVHEELRAALGTAPHARRNCVARNPLVELMFYPGAIRRPVPVRLGGQELPRRGLYVSSAYPVGSTPYNCL